MSFAALQFSATLYLANDEKHKRLGLWIKYVRVVDRECFWPLHVKVIVGSFGVKFCALRQPYLEIGWWYREMDRNYLGLDG